MILPTTVSTMKMNTKRTTLNIHNKAIRATLKCRKMSLIAFIEKDCDLDDSDYS